MFLLGQCQAFIKAISDTPILPQHHQQLLNVSLIRGAQATTAIEGNTLSESEIRRIYQGEKLPPSKEYQQIEVQNILTAFDQLLNEIIFQQKVSLITPKLIKRLHILVSQNLGKHLDAVPGKFRNDDRSVGTYRAPEYRDVDELVTKLCNWLPIEFNIGRDQQFHEVLIEAIVAHIYLEWIHPFGDGNGRTGRLLEFYILLRGGNPDIASHILSNHYNNTRSEYYRQFDLARDKKDLTDFIEYSLLGFRDGLEKTLEVIQQSQHEITWKNHIYSKFSQIKIGSEVVFKRRRNLILAFPIDQSKTLSEIRLLTPKIARIYATISDRSLLRDLKELREMNLLKYSSGRYTANFGTVRSYVALRPKQLN